MNQVTATQVNKQKSIYPNAVNASDERRIGMAPIPESIDLYMNEQQLAALQTMEYFGWELAFVRRADLNNIIPVIKNAKKGEFAVLDAEGDIIRSPDIGIRH